MNKNYGFGAFEDDVNILKKFAQSNNKQQPAKVFPAPEVPAWFVLMHKFADGSPNEGSGLESSKDAMNLYLKSSSERGEVLGEQFIQPDSVFDLLKPSDREFLQKLKAKPNETEEKIRKNKEDLEKKAKADKEKAEKKVSDKEKKNLRYESFISMVKNNYKG